MSSESSSVANLKKQIDEIAEINIESSQNVSDLLADINLLSPKSNSSPTSPNESDDHLLDFLDDSELCNETPKSHKYINSFSPQEGSSFALSSSNSNVNSPNSANIDHESDVNSFLTAFNTKYDLAACSLFDVLDLIDSLLSNSSKKQKKNEEEKRQKSAADEIIQNNNMASIKNENNALRSKLDEATNSMKDAQHLIQTLEQQVENLKSTNSFLQKSNDSLQNDISNLQNSLNSIHSLMENQLDDLSTLGSQRSELIEITKKQDALIQQYDQTSKSIQQTIQQQIQNNQLKQEKSAALEENQNNLQNKKRTEDELYNIMSSLIRIVDDSQLNNELSDNIHSIRDNSQLRLNERIINIINNVIEFASIKNEKCDQYTKEHQKALNSQITLRKKCIEILTLFEEELNFLQNLSHSSDLQSIVFNAGKKSTSPLMTEDIRSELIRQCASLGTFVEETIGIITLEKFEESFEVPDGIEGTHIFDLLQSSQAADSLSKLFENFDNENIEVRELFDLFSAQVFINSLLKNHTNELLMRISHCGREISNLRQELDEQATDQEQTDTMKKLIKHFRHRDNKLRRYLSKYIRIPEDTPTNDLVIALLEGYDVQEKSKKNSKNKRETVPLIQENKQLKEDLEHCIKELNQYKTMLANNQNEQNEESLNQIKQLQLKLEECKQNCKELKSQLDSTLEELETLKTSNTEKDLKIEEFASQIEPTEKSHQNALREANERIDFTLCENKKMKQQISSFENTMVKVKKNRQQLGREIDRLKKINMQLTESLDSQHNKMKSEYCSTIRDLTETNEKLTREISNLQSQVQILTAKNQQLSSENATLNIAKKSADLKLRSIDEKINLEKKNLQSQISAQVTAAQVEQSKMINEMNSLIDDVIERLSSLSYSTDPILQSQNTDSQSLSSTNRCACLKHTVSIVEEEFNRARKTQSMYVDLLETVKEAEKLLNIQSPDRLVNEIQLLLSEQSKNDKTLSENEKKVKIDRQELEKLKRDSKKHETEIIQLKQWENWAKRIHRIIHEAEYAHLDSDQLRQALEEALLASVSSRSIFLRVESLRVQKNILMKYDKRFLNSHQSIRPSICPIIAICLCIRRMQKVAGCLPLSISNTESKLNISLKRKSIADRNTDFSIEEDIDININHRPSLSSKKSQSSRKDRETPRKKKSSSKHNQKERNSCKSPLRPLIPMFV